MFSRCYDLPTFTDGANEMHNVETGLPAVTRPLTFREVADRWGRHPSTIFRNVKAGKLPAPVMLCGRHVFTPAQIQAVETGAFAGGRGAE